MLKSNLAVQSEVVTMSSLEISTLVGKRHDNVKRTIESLAEKGVIAFPQFEEKATAGRPVMFYVFEGEQGKRDSIVVVAQLSPEFTAKLVDRWQELEKLVSGAVFDPTRALNDPVFLRNILLEYTEKVEYLEVANKDLTNKVESMENLFKEGMTPTQFCKMLNGVNVMLVGRFLEDRKWLYNESKTRIRWRTGNYARDKYLTEHQSRISVHGGDDFIKYTPVLLHKGAVRLYQLYLKSLLPMKSTWNGVFTHDKELKGNA
ncbi:Phage regulatory protein Rha (Phage_pRha) [Izhakiella capsodis]|uniref:Phage regulatory protein Rha (Phage_pRha) n=1 Tax=Izhakiella capsodis TaxID=1367852 RepID=A0A1I4ZCW3_9GAMM|nr:Rha family transcriptional regulator [Izhakiella capsodis]SFN48132.1 Phage regulatory protein Rha (Phage_pRha) [Izhakiella capsodis]